MMYKKYLAWFLVYNKHSMNNNSNTNSNNDEYGKVYSTKNFSVDSG